MKVTPTEGSYQSQAVLIDTKPTTRQTKFKVNALSQVSGQINNLSMPLLMNHNSNSFPSGRWYEAKVNEDQEVISKFFVPYEVPEYQDIKSRIDTKLLDSVSIGFSAAVHDCSICGNSISDWENCNHIPGKVYDGKTCYVLLDDITMQEGSLVYAGAVPAAKIQESYAACGCKKDFCEQFSFEAGQLETVISGLIIQDNTETIKKGHGMDIQDKFNTLQDNYSALAVDNSSMKTKIIDLEAKYIADRAEDVKTIEAFTVKESAFESEKDALTADIAKYKAESEALTGAKEALITFTAKLTEKVEALAAPFEATYTAPDTVEGLLVDLDTYLTKSKELPTGRQSLEGEKEYSFKPKRPI